MRKHWGERIAGIVCIGLSVFFGIIALDFPAGGDTFPLFAAGGTIFLSLLMIIHSYISKNPGLREKIKSDWSYDQKKPLIIFLAVMGHTWLIFVIGYFTSAILFFIIATLLVGIRQYKTIFLTGIILFPAMYAFFVLFLKAQLPRGILF